MPTEIDLDYEGGDVDLFQIPTIAGPVTYGMGQDGQVYLSLDLHPAGAGAAMTRVVDQGVTWVPNGAVDALVPAQWLVTESMGDSARLNVIDKLLAYTQKAHR